MNSLKHKAEFEKILAHYRMSDESKQILRETTVVLLLAPSASGRNTIIRHLMKTGEYHFIVSDTTRQPRVNDGVPEQNGVEYWFRKEEDVLADLKDGKFVEAEILHKKYVSGMSIREVKNARDQDKIAITDIDLMGMLNVLNAKEDTVAVLVLPPNFEEWLRRFNSRGHIEEQEYHNRLETALKIFQTGLERDFNFVINDTLEDAAEQVHQLARYGTKDGASQAKGRELVEQLYIETKAYLGL